jgi:tetratricopeptide (TPR) repeat protein
MKIILISFFCTLFFTSGLGHAEKNESNEFEQLAEQFKFYYSQHDFSNALKVSGQLINKYSDRPYSHLSRLYLFEAYRENNKVIEFADLAIEILNVEEFTKDDLYHYYTIYALKGAAATNIGDFRLGHSCFTIFIESGFKDTYVFHFRAMVSIELNQLDLALEDINVALSIQPNNPEYLMTKGGVLSRMYNLTEALEYYNQVKVLNPSLEIIDFYIGDAYFLSRKYVVAKVNFQKYLKGSNLIPRFKYESEFKIAECNFHLGDYESSYQFFRNMWFEYQGDIIERFYKLLIESCLNLKKYDEGKKYILQAKDRFPNEIYFNLMLFRQNTNDYANIELKNYLMDTVLSKESFLSENYLYLLKTDIAYENLNDINLALSILDQAISKFPYETIYLEQKLELEIERMNTSGSVTKETFIDAKLHLLGLINQILPQVINDKEKTANLVLKRAMLHFQSSDFDAALKDMNFVVNSLSRVDDYAFRAVIKTFIHANNNLDNSVKNKEVILQDIDYAISKSDGLIRGFYLVIKSLILKQFGEHKAACKCIKSVRKPKQYMEKSEIRKICRKNELYIANWPDWYH